MMEQIPESQLEDISRFILDHTGLHFPPKKWKALNKGVSLAARALGYSPPDFAAFLLSSPPKEDTMNAIIGYLTIGETYFFRDKNLFQVLGDQILRGLIEAARKTQKKINIWSAGCATGEEPYSVAILLDQLFPDLEGWEINIAGTDINPLFLEKAKKGAYTSWSLRETPQYIVKDYFIQKTQGSFEVVPKIKKRVVFSQLNLMGARYAPQIDWVGPMHLILCRNVLMYFNEKTRNHVVQNLCGRLAENGWLITGPAESGFVRFPDLTRVKLANTMFHQKTPKIPTKGKKSGVAIDVKPDKKRKPDSLLKPSKTGDKARERPDPAATTPGDYTTYQAALKDYEKGDYKQAATRLTELLEESSKKQSRFLLESDLLLLLARSYANLGELEKARDWCEKAMLTQKLNPEPYFLQSSISQAAGDINTAVRLLRRALYLDPEFIMAHFTLGLLLLQNQETREAIKSMNNALALLETKDPDEILAHAEGISVKRLMETIYGIIHEDKRIDA